MQTIHLDVSNKGVVPAIYAKQGDVGRKFRAVITDNGEAYDIPEDALLSVWYSGTSGEGNYSMIGENSAFSIDGNTVTVELITQMLANHGGGNVCLVMNRKDGTQIGTWNIPYIVEQLPGMGSPAAEQYFTALSEVAGKAAESAAKAAEAAATFETDATLSVAGKAADAAATGAAIKKARPVNLLDNSDFRNPVNQRGRMDNTESGYTIDRWELSEAGEADVQVQSPENGFDENRILFIVASGRADLIQRLENYAQQEGKTHTLAINVEGMVHIVTFAMGQKAGGLAIGDTGLTFYSTPSDHVLLRLDTAKRVSLYWAALYEGEYTAETLPEYKPKGYGAELAECQRYFIRLTEPNYPYSSFAGIGSAGSSTNCMCCCPIPVTMRIIPTVSAYRTELLTKSLDSFKLINTVSVYAANAHNQIVLSVNSAETLAAGDLYYLVCRYNDGYIDLSADL